MPTFEYEYTDTFGGEANYCWVRRGKVTVPELTHYGYDGLYGYHKANKAQTRELVRKVKSELGLTGVRPKSRGDYGDMIRMDFPLTVLFISFCDEELA